MTGGRKGYKDYGRKRKTGIGAWSPLLFWCLARVLLLGVNVDRKCEKMEPGVGKYMINVTYFSLFY